ncbi:hypothetical protein NECAME_07371 [Necator americanus]|uniref:Uncharacterized protein n=1 Tax=Necator americanus TaxID=51031 RepID=W2TQW1_NECAM|nr:hypothetical protein NECAME_07371 [Necator americanus]ETN83417.1 hypothetical protein NECAME_07371 [Necator americanus]
MSEKKEKTANDDVLRRPTTSGRSDGHDKRRNDQLAYYADPCRLDRGIIAAILTTIKIYFRTAITNVLQEDSETSFYAGRLLPSSFGMGWKGYMMPIYTGEKSRETRTKNLYVKLQNNPSSIVQNNLNRAHFYNKRLPQ